MRRDGSRPGRERKIDRFTLSSGKGIMGMDGIKVENVTKQWKGFRIENLNFTVPQGYITGFIGPNGSGKSTVIRMIMGVMKPDKGEIRIFGRPNDDVKLKQKIGFVYDTLFLYEEFNIKKAKAMIAPLYPDWDEELYQKYLHKFELPEGKKIKKFSQGMKMITSLLFALSHRPELIIMDEPTSGLDPVFRRELLEELQELMVNERQTVFFSTHITQDLDQIADYIIFMNRGKLEFQKSMEEIREQFFLVKGSAEQLDSDLKNLFAGWKQTSGGFTGLYAGDPSFLAGLEDFLVEPASLEDILYFMTRKENGR
ncbi:MAG: sodium ABC transporter ATP-binding protein [Caldibacillus debilis]|nr:MAG: sodium ABC transporter ATP-binding protein [Caldibacillus debilis]